MVLSPWRAIVARCRKSAWSAMVHMWSSGRRCAAGLDVDLIPPTSVAFSDGYFVFSHADGRISHTDTDNAHVIDGLAYSAAESSPDKLLRVIGLQQYVLAFGERSRRVVG